MAQAIGGTAGTSGMTSGQYGGTGESQGNGGSSGNGGNGASTTTSSESGSLSKVNSAAESDNKGWAGLQSLAAQVADARAARTSGIQSGIQSAVNDAFGTSASSPAEGAMNTPEAQAAAGVTRGAYDKGYADQTNAGVTQSAFGMTGSLGSAVGAGVGALQTADKGAAPDSYSAGQAAAKEAGLGRTTSSLASLAGGLLGGPVGAALASMATGAASYAMQRENHPSAFNNQTQQSMGPVSGSDVGQNADSNGGMSSALSSSNTSATAPFAFANDYDYGSYQKLGLEKNLNG